MSEWGARLQVARWEFLRFVKPKQLVVSFIIMLAMGGVGFFVGRMAQRAQAKPRNVAVIGGEKLGIKEAGAAERLSFKLADMSALQALRDSLTARTIDGILIVESVDSARLIVRRNPPWKTALELHLAALRRQVRLSEAGLAPEQLATMLAPVSVATEFQSGNDGRGARIAAMIAVGLVLYGVFTSMAYILVSVTAEKQLRVTEQVISAISPQTWIDGKIIGISGVALVNVLIFLFGAAVWILGPCDRDRIPVFDGLDRAGADALDHSVRRARFCILAFGLWSSRRNDRRPEQLDARPADVRARILFAHRIHGGRKSRFDFCAHRRTHSTDIGSRDAGESRDDGSPGVGIGAVGAPSGRRCTSRSSRSRKNLRRRDAHVWKGAIMEGNTAMGRRSLTYSYCVKNELLAVSRIS